MSDSRPLALPQEPPIRTILPSTIFFFRHNQLPAVLPGTPPHRPFGELIRPPETGSRAPVVAGAEVGSPRNTRTAR